MKLPDNIDEFSVFEVFYVLHCLIGEERLRGDGREEGQDPSARPDLIPTCISSPRSV